MSLIKVTSEDLHGLAGHIAQGSGNIQDQLNHLRSHVDQVLGGEWIGDASGQFGHLYEEWNRSAAGLKDALDGIHNLTHHAAMKYQTTEDEIRSSMAG
jgi:WXG100 family type VII secretion target